MEEASATENHQKRRLELNWDKLLPDTNDEPQPLIVVPNTTAAAATATATAATGKATAVSEEFRLMSDQELNDSIRRQSSNLGPYSLKLPDKGEKLRANLKRLEDERERRKIQRLDKANDECVMATQSNCSTSIGVSNGFKRQAPSSQSNSQSSFGSLFTKKLEETDLNGIEERTCRKDNAFEKEISHFYPCDNQPARRGGAFSRRGRQKSKPSSRESAFKCPTTISRDKDKHTIPNGDEVGGDSSTFSRRHFQHLSKKMGASKPSNVSRPTKTYFLVDEDEPELPEAMQDPEDTEVAKCMKDATIYYPSQDDPKSVEICYSDIDCLAPTAFLSSTIMNFYIRYLQQGVPLTNGSQCSYHFFNTYFYKKLKEAVPNKKADTEAFLKLRRWWKGVNIFQMPYILLPIHEELHWSLVIICVPDKKDETGLIILHLDSLGYHNSKSIFENIRSFLIAEWNFLRKETTQPYFPLAERIWKNLPRRIDDKIIKVPQQKNDYDCGLFVLFFMKRFIEEAPERLKREAMVMFGRQWFKSEEASGLRSKIKILLKEEFKKASENNNATSGTLPLPPSPVCIEAVDYS